MNKKSRAADSSLHGLNTKFARVAGIVFLIVVVFFLIMSTSAAIYCDRIGGDVRLKHQTSRVHTPACYVSRDQFKKIEIDNSIFGKGIKYIMVD
jgi:hypothetical protein